MSLECHLIKVATRFAQSHKALPIDENQMFFQDKAIKFGKTTRFHSTKYLRREDFTNKRNDLDENKENIKPCDFLPPPVDKALYNYRGSMRRRKVLAEIDISELYESYSNPSQFLFFPLQQQQHLNSRRKKTGLKKKGATLKKKVPLEKREEGETSPVTKTPPATATPLKPPTEASFTIWEDPNLENESQNESQNVYDNDLSADEEFQENDKPAGSFDSPFLRRLRAAILEKDEDDDDDDDKKAVPSTYDLF
ncbi:hypothetical protein G9A89_004347 [Geosiphon pyriformis]|nr:hypothetical protein G9A89_004347 [Geosiphon pyriformis]